MLTEKYAEDELRRIGKLMEAEGCFDFDSCDDVSHSVGSFIRSHNEGMARLAEVCRRHGLGLDCGREDVVALVIEELDRLAPMRKTKGG